MSNIAIIPARLGSKRLPRKNTLEFCGKPLIEWTIEAAVESKVFDEICVTTDCDEIIALTEALGISVPFKRPDWLASDTATSVDVVTHAIDYYKRNGVLFDTLCLLQPTSPLRTSQNIKEAYELFMRKSAGAVVSVCEDEHPRQWSGILDESMRLDDFLSQSSVLSRSQDCQKTYRLNGAIYFARVQDFVKERTFLLKHDAYAYEMTREESVDIDTKLDFVVAQCILSYSKMQKE